ncbi:universal stress protein [Amaricoccus solimangrovi]|uniref:Universal stress protein n=1 Tax=Amaricoccus solimangrovi TaxID=2589815 RepID=A0A501WNF3_9RHOB|nr:universal stress protein [Amaricoccus solimangrovi]TPE49734.1 universal stress protein [Amaricoccus solimangrovi]
MYRKIMIPVDLAHKDKIGKALDTGADLALHYKIPVCYVAVTSNAPGPMGHNPREFAQALAAFGEAEAARRGIETTTRAILSHDPAVDLEKKLLGAIGETGSDLVVMASHIPNVADHIWPSNGGRVASHADVSVLIVR